MGLFSWLFSKATTGVIEATGEAVTKVIRVTKGDKAAVQEHVHDEQMAVLAEHAAEFVARPTRTHLDSIIDFLNRLPRVIITFWIFAVFTWPAIDADSFMRYILSMELVPEPMWQIAMVVLSLYFGGRILSQDIKPPRLTKEQRDLALKEIRKREQAIVDARTPLIVEIAPSRKPAPPSWAQDILDKHPQPPEFKPQPDAPIVKGRPADIDRMIAALIDREGGFVNDPDDDGGPTCYGVTQATLEAWREKDCTEDEVKALTREEAAEIYRCRYYFDPSIDSLPLSIQAHVMDIGVNSGPRTAVKLLQQAMNALGGSIKEDGIIGPMTREALAGCDLVAVNNKLVDLRLKLYDAIVAKKPEKRKFLAGWKKRARSFRMA